MTDPTPLRDEAVREHTDRYHKRPFTGFAPRDEKRRKQVVSLPMDVLLAIFRERLAYLQHGSDLDAVAQFVACEIERAMGVFPNLDGAVPAPASGGVDAVWKALDTANHVFHFDLRHMIEWGDDYNQAVKDASDRVAAALASLSPAATPVSGAEPVERGDLIDGLDDLARRMPASADKLLLSEAIGLIQALAKPASSPAGVTIEAIVAAIEDQMPATQDMTSTFICEALERAAAAIRVRSVLENSKAPLADATNDPADLSSLRKGAEVAVTDEMIEAGKEAANGWTDRYMDGAEFVNWDEALPDIFRRMLALVSGSREEQ